MLLEEEGGEEKTFACGLPALQLSGLPQDHCTQHQLGEEAGNQE